MNHLDRTYKAHEYLYGKSVLVIGGADHQGFNPKDFDLVLRVNDHFIRQGGRCDILVHNCCISAYPGRVFDFLGDSILEVGLVVANPHQQPGFKMAKKYCEYSATIFDYFDFERLVYSKEDELQHQWSQVMMEMYDFKPFTGLLAIAYLQHAPVKEIAVTGMDIHVNEKTNPDWVGPHRISAQALWLKHAVAFDGRIRFDKVLNATLDKFDKNLIFQG